MIVECSHCHTKYNVSEEKVPDAGVKVRCHKCQNIIFIEKQEPIKTPTPSEKPQPAPEAPKVPEETVPSPEAQVLVEPQAEIAPEAPQAPEETVPSPEAQAPVEPQAEIAPKALQAQVPKAPAEPELPQAPEKLQTPEVPKPTEEPPVPDYQVEVPTPDSEIPKVPEPELPPEAKGPAVQEVKPTPPPTPMSEEDERWHQRARRLAKALASDLVLYNQAQVAQGLRDGTLAQLLGPEIRRSWEYYCQQIPKHIVDSSDYFKEQLNKIVGKGKEIFK